MMRVFIAIEIDEVVRRDLADLQSELQGKVDIKRSDAKWVNPDNVHLTLKFLGEIKDTEVVEVCNIAREVAARHRDFDIEVGRVGHFGGRSARVLWVGAGDECAELLKLQQDLEDRLAEAGLPKENRKYSGHLTLCRIRNPKAGFKIGRGIPRFQARDDTGRCSDGLSERVDTERFGLYCIGQVRVAVIRKTWLLR